MDMKKSMRKGARMGRPPKELPPEFYEAAERCASGELSCRSAAERCGMPLTTFRSRALSLLGQDGKPRTAGKITRTPSGPDITDTTGACGMATMPRKEWRGRKQEAFLDSLPDKVRRAVLAWMGGDMSLRRAAAAAQMSAKRFKGLVDSAGLKKGAAGIHTQGN
jgi:DNA-directed RNA polymerase specialized sigma24 family protein